ncbi:T9SS type A sorting domain-containing protein [uncultured Draconibacterium sp.]|uniref:T9SS type A sorting domain-containing protein n=1 Tax=uncultured Draconibacterium sp. TaxID=1573823 RepID=UPI00326039AD
MNWEKSTLIILSIFLSVTSFCAYGQEPLLFGSEQQDFGHSIKLYKGAYYVVGTTRKDAQSALDYYVLKIRSNASVEKKYVYGFPKHDVANQIIVDDDGFYILGSAYDHGFPNVDMHLVKLKSNGDKDWEQYYGTEFQDQGMNMIRTKDSGFAMIGFSNSRTDFGDMYIVKTDNKGNLEWQNFFGPSYVDYGFSLIENQAEELILAGTENGFYNPTQTDFLTHDADILLVKTNKTGEQVWYKTFGGNGHDWAKDIITSTDGGYLVCGSTQSFGEGSFDVFLMKINEEGEQVWIKTYGGREFEYGEKLVIGADGNIYISATSASFSDNGKPDHYIIKTDINGELIWSKTFGSNESDYSTGIVATPDSGVVFTGWTNVAELGKTDIVLYKLSKDGNTQLISSILPTDSATSLIVYPNPAFQQFIVEPITANNTELSFSLFTLKGEKILEKPIQANTKNTIQLYVQDGTYIYRVEREGKLIQTGKQVIHKYSR